MAAWFKINKAFNKVMAPCTCSYHVLLVTTFSWALATPVLQGSIIHILGKTHLLRVFHVLLDIIIHTLDKLHARHVKQDIILLATKHIVHPALQGSIIHILGETHLRVFHVLPDIIIHLWHKPHVMLAKQDITPQATKQIAGHVMLDSIIHILVALALLVDLVPLALLVPHHASMQLWPFPVLVACKTGRFL